MESKILRLNRWIGLAGVHEGEGRAARKGGRIFGFIAIFVVVCLVMQWHLEMNDNLSPLLSRLINWSVWLFFVIETSTMLSFVRNKKRYLRGNWLNLIIILGGLPLLWDYSPATALLRGMRILLVISLMTPLLELFWRSLTDNRLGTTVIAAWIAVTLAGVVISAVDPGINSAWDGIWWAWVTVTTVGYGDVVPQSVAGRLLAAVLILLGLGLFAALTANFSTIFLRKGIDEAKNDSRAIKDILEDLREVRHEEEDILRILTEMNGRLDGLETSLKTKENPEVLPPRAP